MSYSAANLSICPLKLCTIPGTSYLININKYILWHSMCEGAGGSEYLDKVLHKGWTKSLQSIKAGVNNKKDRNITKVYSPDCYRNYF